MFFHHTPPLLSSNLHPNDPNLFSTSIEVSGIEEVVKILSHQQVGLLIRLNKTVSLGKHRLFEKFTLKIGEVIQFIIFLKRVGIFDYQVIQAVTFLSPFVGGHDSPFQKGHSYTHPQKMSAAELRETRLLLGILSRKNIFPGNSL